MGNDPSQMVPTWAPPSDSPEIEWGDVGLDRLLQAGEVEQRAHDVIEAGRVGVDALQEVLPLAVAERRPPSDQGA